MSPQFGCGYIGHTVTDRSMALSLFLHGGIVLPLLSRQILCQLQKQNIIFYKMKYLFIIKYQAFKHPPLKKQKKKTPPMQPFYNVQYRRK